MRQVETDWWVMDLPDEWRAEQDEATVVVTDTDEVGDISITTLQPESGEVVDDDLVRLIGEAGLSLDDGRKVSLGDFSGWYFELEEDEEYIREWYVAGGNIVLLINYGCDVDNCDMDRDAVDQILGTLEPKG